MQLVQWNVYIVVEIIYMSEMGNLLYNLLDACTDSTYTLWKASPTYPQHLGADQELLESWSLMFLAWAMSIHFATK